MTNLAIVIPAYKSKFLSQTLDALCGQTNKHFNLYIGDDSSPEPIYSIIEPYLGKLNIVYHRFDSNMGRKSLANHWNRCIDLTKEEKWIWLLPDDDFPSSDCVDSFFKESISDVEGRKLYRFNTIHLDEFDNVCFKPNICPKKESNIDFILNKISFVRNSSVAEYIFSKTEYEKVGKFTHLPLAWGSDDLLWIKLSNEEDIVTNDEGIVYLHQSSLNISNNRTDFTSKKIMAKYEMFLSIISDKTIVKKLTLENKLTYFNDKLIQHFFYEYKSYQLKFSIAGIFKYAYLNNRLFGGGFIKNTYRILRFNKRK